MLSIKKMLFISSILLISAMLTTQASTEKVVTSETLQIGLMVEAVQTALLVRDQQSLQTISLYGTDSRYYSMIRGWLFQELVGVESQLHASKTLKNSEKFQSHSNFLKKAIISIDLE